MTAFAFYLLKVMICSGVLFLYYYLALRNKLFHQWNRFYLLAAIIISLIAPVVQVTIMHSADEPDKAIQVLQVFESAGGYLEEVTISGRPSISTDQWLLMGYIVISGIFLLSVLLSFQKIISIVKSHTVQWIEKIGFISTKVQGTPFSFFNYIFWNEEIDLQTETGKQIFQHELVHVKEKHTIDKLFVQLVLMVFWCNPFFWLIRRELKLIHEFIADKKSVGEHGTAALAAMILNASYPTRFNSLTNQFFQTSIKRRIAMLAKIQNPRINYLSRILAFSILVVTVLAFTLRTKKLTVPSVKLDKTITVVIDAGHGMENGRHSGAVVDNVAEDDIVLAIANKIKELNSNDEIKIIFTRPTEQITDLHKRVDVARENNADLFLSLHINAVPPNSGNSGKEMSGFQIYVSNKQTAFRQESEILGSVLREELNTVYPTETSLYKRQTGVWVLDQNVCPSVMVECGWLTTKKDREFIAKEKNQEEVARKILEAIGRYASNQQTGKINSSITRDTGILNVIFKADVDGAQANSGKIILSNSLIGIPNDIWNTELARIVVIINGKRVDPASLIGKQIISKTATIYEKNQPEAISKYGNEAKNGVVIFEDARIEELTNTNGNSDTVPKNPVTIKELTVENPKASDQDNVFRNKWDALNPPIIILDGKEVSEKDFKKFDANDIISMSVLKGQTATGLYGEKAKNGAIIITTKNKVEMKEVTLSPIDTVPQKSNQSKIREIVIDGQKLSSDEVRFKDISWEQAKNSKLLVVADGKLVQSINDVNPSTIASIYTATGHPLVKMYGDKAAPAVIFIITKNFKNTEDLNQVFTRVEIEASVNQKEWVSHLQKNLLSPIETAASKGMDIGTYTVQVRFLVLKDGTVTDVKALNDPGYGLADAAVRTVKTGPKWNPGMQNKKPVNSYHTQPINFVIQEQGNGEKKRVPPEVTLSELKKWDRLNILNLVSFELVYLNDDGKGVTKHQNMTGKFDETTKNILAKRKPGDLIAFERITAEENGYQVKKEPLLFKITQ